ncbi:HET-domain-containing protein, partial [Lindgomyces ingoldianus]
MDISTSSVASLDLALDWYKSCFNSHNQCQIPLNEDTDWRPTRLVDIGLKHGDMWHLRTCSSLPPGPVKYMTLSYRWGSTSSLRLLQGNIDMLHQGLPISQLPKTFQDAVSIARHFSIRYLWIDALCIIQDFSTDWSSEAPTMRYVYSHSTCNIAATAAIDQDSGLFRQRNKEEHLPRTITAPSGALKHLGESFVLFDKEYWNRQLAQGTLHNRGWVFQECLLAPRVLYFTGNQIMWECFQETKCERFLRGIPYHEGLKNLTILWDSLDGRKESKRDAGAGNMTLQIQNLWNHLLESYSSRALTRSEDRLPALAGVARLFADTTGDEYLCGLWRSKLIEQLLWRVPRPTLRAPTQLGVPSWSWA